ncbi:DUF4129 domain-containing protein [Paenibacillus koleovorans]|uniref:DUF4129 domain-containing protein n=1 Tax=Paenibacillus koleovorans TaxID=121608 RepID=UPI000FD8AAE6|nr:DUF4129 domain-containing protein [Paenibacillus koleovorans]
MIDRSEWLEDKQRLGEILSRDEYSQHLKERTGDSGLIKEGMRWLWDKFIGLFPPAADWSDEAANVGMYVLLGIVLLALIWAIYWFCKQIIRQGNVRRRKTIVDSSEMALTYEQYASMARQAKAEGRIRESIRCSFLMLLFYMEQQNWIRIEKWKTDWDYCDELERSRASAVPLFQRSALLFEQVWYGNEPADPDSFLAFQRDIDALMAEKEAI